METYYNRSGNQITKTEWQTLFRKPDYRLIELSFHEELLVCTSWFGINFSLNPEDPPVFFETVVFDGDQQPKIHILYSTEEEASSGHFKIFNEINSLSIPPLRGIWK